MSKKSTLTLLEVYELLKAKRWVDLTHSFAPGIPHWPGFPNEEREALYYYDEGVGKIGSGIYIHRYSHVGQWGPTLTRQPTSSGALGCWIKSK